MLIDLRQCQVLRLVLATQRGGAAAQILCGHEVGVGSVLPDNLQVLRPRRSAGVPQWRTVVPSRMR